MKYFGLLVIFFTIMSCCSTNKATDTSKSTDSINNTDIQMEAKKMIADGYLAGQISISKEEGDCPVTIMVKGKEGAYYLDPIDLKEDFQTDGEKIWFKYNGLRIMNRCVKANPISIIEIVKSN